MFHQNIETALKRNRFSGKLLRQLQDQDVNVTHQDAFERLAMRPEINVIIDAAKMLGSLGLKGSEYPAAMPFHVVAMRLVMYRDAI